MHDSIFVDVYRNGVFSHNTNEPDKVEEWCNMFGIPFSEISLDLAQTKVWKEQQLRDFANNWYQNTIRGFEGVMVSRKEGRGGNLTAEEISIRDQMVSNYDRLKTLISTTKGRTTWQGVLSVSW